MKIMRKNGQLLSSRYDRSHSRRSKKRKRAFTMVDKCVSRAVELDMVVRKRRKQGVCGSGRERECARTLGGLFFYLNSRFEVHSWGYYEQEGGICQAKQRVLYVELFTASSVRVSLTYCLIHCITLPSNINTVLLRNDTIHVDRSKG